MLGPLRGYSDDHVGSPGSDEQIRFQHPSAGRDNLKHSPSHNPAVVLEVSQFAAPVRVRLVVQAADLASIAWIRRRSLNLANTGLRPRVRCSSWPDRGRQASHGSRPRDSLPAVAPILRGAIALCIGKRTGSMESPCPSIRWRAAAQPGSPRTAHACARASRMLMSSQNARGTSHPQAFSGIIARLQ
jgi:hypothetical protein